MPNTTISTNLTGRYRLDPHCSDALLEHFQAMNFDEVPCLASKQVEVELEVVHTPNRYITVFQRTQVGHTTRMLPILGREHFIEEKSSNSWESPLTRKVTVEQLEDSIITTTCFTNGVITTKQYINSKDQFVSDIDLKLFNKNINEVIRHVQTRRVYDRVGEVSEDVLKEHNKRLDTQDPGVIRVPSSSIRQQRQKEMKKLNKKKV